MEKNKRQLYKLVHDKIITPNEQELSKLKSDTRINNAVAQYRGNLKAWIEHVKRALKGENTDLPPELVKAIRALWKKYKNTSIYKKIKNLLKKKKQTNESLALFGGIGVLTIFCIVLFRYIGGYHHKVNLDVDEAYTGSLRDWIVKVDLSRRVKSPDRKNIKKSARKMVQKRSITYDDIRAFNRRGAELEAKARVQFDYPTWTIVNISANEKKKMKESNLHELWRRDSKDGRCKNGHGVNLDEWRDGIFGPECPKCGAPPANDDEMDSWDDPEDQFSEARLPEDDDGPSNPLTAEINRIVFEVYDGLDIYKAFRRDKGRGMTEAVYLIEVPNKNHPVLGPGSELTQFLAWVARELDGELEGPVRHRAAPPTKMIYRWSIIYQDMYAEDAAMGAANSVGASKAAGHSTAYAPDAGRRRVRYAKPRKRITSYSGMPPSGPFEK